MDDYQEPPEPTIEEERDYYKRERNRLQSELATAQRTIEELKDAYGASRNATKLIEDDLNSKLQSAMEERDAAKLEISGLQNQVRVDSSGYQEVINSLRIQLSAAREERAGAEKWFKAELAKLESIRQERDSANSRLEEAEKERDRFKAGLAEWEQAWSEKGAELLALHVHVGELREALRFYHTDSPNWKKADAALSSRPDLTLIEELRTRIEKAKAMIDRPEFHKLLDECLTRLSKQQ